MTDPLERLIARDESGRCPRCHELQCVCAGSFAGLWPVHLLTYPNAATERDSVYRERAFLIAALARMVSLYDGVHPFAPGALCSAWIGPHTFVPGQRWDVEWLNVVYVRLPTGLVSWHIHQDELPLFAFLPRFDPDGDYRYDGHTTAEKYRRVWEYVTGRKT